MTLLQRLANVDDPQSLANRLRSRRFEHFEQLVADMPRPLRIIDLGGTPDFWIRRGWADRPGVHVTTVNLEARASTSRNIVSLRGDATNLAELPARSFDVAFSNSVIEHLGSPVAQAAMACEMRRLASAIWVQTPNYWFPVEPHFHVPGWQWLPRRLRIALLRRRRCGWRGPCPDAALAAELVDEVRLLSRRELASLFPGATIVPERFGGMTKSWIVIDGFDGAHSSSIPLPPDVRRPTRRVAA